jgi:hypothetical protein
MNALKSLRVTSLRSVESLFMQHHALLQPQVPCHYHLFSQARGMSKYLSNAAKKRLPMTSKRAHKGYYKGKGATKEGRLTSKARFVVDPLKRLELVVPNMIGFKVRNYVPQSPTSLNLKIMH